MEINVGDINGLLGDTFGVKPNELFMDINGGDKNGIFLHDLIKITEGTVSEGTIFMHIVLWCQPIKLIQVVSTSEFHEY